MSIVAWKKIILNFMSLLTASIVKNNVFLAGIYIIFLKKCPGSNLKVFGYQRLSEKIEKVVVKFQKETVWNALGLLKLRTKSRLKESWAS